MVRKRSPLICLALLVLLAWGGRAWTATPDRLLPLSAAETAAQLDRLPEGWVVEGQQLSCTYQFADFVAAIAFVNRLVEPAEAAGHHPDLTIRYSRVEVSLTTHDAGGLTQQDFDLAQAIAQLSSVPACQADR